MSLILGILALLAVCLYVLRKWASNTFGTFSERGIAHKKPLPFIGNAWKFIRNQESLHKIMLNLYRETKQHKIYGFYMFRAPFFIVNDPELIKQFGIKDFESFANHQPLFGAGNEPLLQGMLNVMKDQRWKDMRNNISPVFTGSKMRSMFTLLNECFAESLKYLHSQLNGENSKDIELKDTFKRLSNDVIATTAFGLKINSFVDVHNEFYTLGQSFTDIKGLQAAKFMLYSMAPKLFKFLGISAFDPKKTNYFTRLIVDAMKYREEHKIVRPDMIQLLMEVQQETAQHWSIDELVAQCFIFFFAAFENNANLICTTCHELMDNPHIQARLYEEIVNTRNELAGKTLDYDALLKMKYLDMVVSESLRKWTLGALTDRECGKDYTVRDESGNFVCELKKGDRVWFQMFGLHWDEEYFDQPEKFEPERFSEQNKRTIKPYTYLPFGVGPRICIGSRYALMQAKAMLYYLLIDFKLERSEKTCLNLLNDIRGFQITPKNGFWFKLVKRA